MTEPKLTVELVPSSCWYTNVRSNISKAEWDSLRRKIYKRAGYVCEICGGHGDHWPVECHEVWHFDEKNKVQKLIKLIALCPKCHHVKHFGLSQIHGREQEAYNHLSAVNGWTSSQAKKYIASCFEVWEKRSLIDWTLDITHLTKGGLATHEDSQG